MFAKSAVAFASLALFVQAASAAQCTRTYTIKEGDYCDSISAAQGVSTYQLAVLNAGKINPRCDNLVPGDELCLGTDEVDCRETTVVIAGNTCSAIWDENTLDSEIFYLNNPQVSRDCRNIYIDEVLCIAKTVQVPPAPTVPIHTGPPPAEATPPVPLDPAPTPAPEGENLTPEPINEAPPAPEEEECEDEYEEIEVIYGSDDESIPYCDEL
ncbi:hypothetical protein CC1G_05860 [Coprinopsis cinerea okayama7|uniref:LysM domain-containing protein n=1 Tax=Coprinopsis cinerea (strain Okayama-7 / 130 / ATCC MYA-4618 / FGSC 9003) TaxID=240176 RepID=A8NLM0_COPC7|nr:hypothetical protein CC1G_05860 [Coprinopsis cinerea okayama7\|eukprot:XP_001834723.1 hypothetical protein CC1G_05860 [Coprinopsis cinerea okayama7\